MTNKLDLFRCNICGNIVEVVISGGGTLVCCGQDMELLKAGTTDGSAEKHVPQIEKNNDDIVIRVGSQPHPMISEHYIMFIEAISKDEKWVKRKYLKPGEAPEMAFKCLCEKGIDAREYCNIHGLWANFDY